MTCPTCGRDNPSDAEFCGNCGSRLSTGPEGTPYRPFDAADERSSSMIDRMFAAARLDVQTYEDIEADPGATGQAAKVVVIVSIASGIGLLGSGGFQGLVLGVVLGVVQWAVLAFITYWIGTGILRTPETHATWGQLARTTGFALSPGVLKVFGFIPALGGAIFFAASMWQLTAMVVAVRQALDYESSWRAVGVVIIGFVVYGILFVIIFGLIFGGFNGSE